MIIVADTSPLNYLLRLEQIELLPELYGRIIVPLAVLRELSHPAAPAEVRTWAEKPPSWLQVLPVAELDSTLSAVLGAGEREAISLAAERSADLLLIDEWAGRKQAEARNLQVAGTIFVLLQAALRGRLQLAEALNRLKRSGFRLSPSLEARILTQYHARKSPR